MSGCRVIQWFCWSQSKCVMFWLWFVVFAACNRRYNVFKFSFRFFLFFLLSGAQLNTKNNHFSNRHVRISFMMRAFFLQCNQLRSVCVCLYTATNYIYKYISHKTVTMRIEINPASDRKNRQQPWNETERRRNFQYIYIHLVENKILKDDDDDDDNHRVTNGRHETKRR